MYLPMFWQYFEQTIAKVAIVFLLKIKKAKL